MMLTRFTSFLLVYILLHARNSTAFIPKAMEKREVSKGDESPMNVNKETSAAMGDEVSNRRVKGRKMMMKWVAKEEMKDEDLDVEKRKNSGEGNCKHRKNGKCKMMSNNRNNSHRLKENMVGYTAFSADYHVPKPHPPKHN